MQSVIIEYEGRQYEFDFDDIGVKAAIKIEKHTGMILRDWGKSLSPEEEGVSAPLVSMQALGWLVLHGGKDIPIEDCDFKLLKLGEAFAKAAEAEAARRKAAEEAADAAAGPTPPPPPPNGSGGGSIPVLSRPSSPTG
jgi:hypothetical protein